MTGRSSETGAFSSDKVRTTTHPDSACLVAGEERRADPGAVRTAGTDHSHSALVRRTWRMFHSQETYNSREMCAVVRSTDWSDVVIEISNLELYSSQAHTQQEKGQVRLETHLLDIPPELVGDLSGRNREICVNCTMGNSKYRVNQRARGIQVTTHNA